MGCFCWKRREVSLKKAILFRKKTRRNIKEKQKQREERRLAREAAKANATSPAMPEIHIERPAPAPVPEEPVNAIRQELPFDVQELKPVTGDEVQADPDISKGMRYILQNLIQASHHV